MKHRYVVYILTNWNKTVLYTGVTNNLEQRITEHYLNRGKPETFAGKYNCHFLVYYEPHQYVRNAIQREKEIKNRHRSEKDSLIAQFNPEWKFLNSEVMVWPPKDSISRGH